MSAIGALLDATLGRRLLVRIWIHGVLLFGGVLIAIVVAHDVLPRQTIEMTARGHPALSVALAERALALREDRTSLPRELGRLHDELSIELTVYGADGARLGSSVWPALAAMTADERRALLPSPGYVAARSASHDRFVVGAFHGGTLEAYAVAVMPAPAAVPFGAFGLVTVALVVALVFVALPLSRSIARPLEQLGAVSRQLGAGDLSVRAPTDRRDEIGDLSRSFNRMAAQIQRLRSAERQLLGDVSHELRTPLARMRVVLDLASDADPEHVRRYVREITTDLSELAQLVDDIITSSRLDPDTPHWAEARPPLRRRMVTTGELLDASALRFDERWPGRTLTVAAPAAELVVDGDPILLRRALDNLVDNARKYSADDTAIIVRVTEDELCGARGVRFEVTDRGVGITPDDWPRVFTPFFRADRSRTRATGGVGLGLALTRRIVEAHRGTVGFHSEPDHGSRFWFVLPRAGVAPAIPDAAAP